MQPAPRNAGSGWAGPVALFTPADPEGPDHGERASPAEPVRWTAGRDRTPVRFRTELVLVCTDGALRHRMWS